MSSARRPGEPLSDSAVAEHAERIAHEGYTVIPDAIEPELIDAVASHLDELERLYEIAPSPNSFEGEQTVRIYNLLAFGEPYLGIPVHPAVLPVVEQVIGRGCLVSSLSSIAILPGERAQPIHADDQLIPLPRPHVPIVCNTMWAMTDFTEANGATRLVPGSHLADQHPDYGATYDTIAAEMPRGSVLVWNGSLWHGGGANHTDARRVGIAMNYCAGWIRQQENQQLGIPRDVAAGFSPQLRALVGYSVYHGLIGHINKRSPAELLDHTAGADQSANGDSAVVWDHI